MCAQVRACAHAGGARVLAYVRRRSEGGREEGREGGREEGEKHPWEGGGCVRTARLHQTGRAAAALRPAPPPLGPARPAERCQAHESSEARLPPAARGGNVAAERRKRQEEIKFKRFAPAARARPGLQLPAGLRPCKRHQHPPRERARGGPEHWPPCPPRSGRGGGGCSPLWLRPRASPGGHRGRRRRGRARRSPSLGAIAAGAAPDGSGGRGGPRLPRRQRSGIERPRQRKKKIKRRKRKKKKLKIIAGGLVRGHIQTLRDGEAGWAPPAPSLPGPGAAAPTPPPCPRPPPGGVWLAPAAGIGRLGEAPLFIFHRDHFVRAGARGDRKSVV